MLEPRVAIAAALAIAGPVLAAPVAVRAAEPAANDRPLPFRTHEIAAFPGAYQVSVADVSGDGRPDVIALSEKPSQLAWFQAPQWTKHALTPKTDRFIDVSPHDVDGDHRLDLPFAAAFELKDSTSGHVAWLRAAGGAEAWIAHDIEAAPSSHRIRWADVDGDGSKELVNVPLLGRGAKAPDYAVPARVVVYRPAGAPGPIAWRLEIVAETLHVVHGVRVVSWDDDAADELLTASFEGVHLHDRQSVRRGGAWTTTRLAEGDQASAAKRGASEVAVGLLGARKTAPGRNPKAFLASIEPWHGHQLVVYTRSRANGPWRRNVVDDTLVDAHALGVADFDGDGRDEIVAGFRGKGRRLLLYRAADDAGRTWQRQILDDGDMACAGIFIADIDQDGRPDIAAAGTASGNVKWYQNLARARR